MPYVGCGLYTAPGDTTVLFNPDGVNFRFFDFDPPTNDAWFALKDQDGWLYIISIFGPDDSQRFGLYDGIDPNFAPPITIDPPPVDGNYEFSADGYFRFLNEDFGGYHYLTSDDQNVRIENPGQLPNPAAYFSSVGNLYKFENSVFYIYDAPNATWRAPYALADINHQNAIIQLT